MTIFSRHDIRRLARTGELSVSRSPCAIGRGAKSHVAPALNQSADLDPACRRGSSVRRPALEDLTVSVRTGRPRRNLNRQHLRRLRVRGKRFKVRPRI